MEKTKKIKTGLKKLPNKFDKNKKIIPKSNNKVFYSSITQTINKNPIQLGRIFRNKDKNVPLESCIQSEFDFIKTPQKAVPTFEPKQGQLKLSNIQPSKTWSLYYDSNIARSKTKTINIPTISFSVIYVKYLKKILDKVLAISMLIITAPILAVVAVLIRVESKGPVLFCQQRTGLNGKNYKMFKFRSMTCNNDVHDLSKENELTKIGKFIRKLSIDELPQIINILRGEMSFIGPRPWIPEYYQRMSHTQRQRNNVLPGITGLAQARGRNDLTIHGKIAFDLEYVKRISIREDLKIIFLTISTFLNKNGYEICKFGIAHELETLERQKVSNASFSNKNGIMR